LSKIDYDNPWYYNDEPFTSEQIGDYVGFVYLITDLTNNKKYIGKKLFISKRKAPPLKGKTRKRTIVKESDWKTYYGSSEEVQTLVETNGIHNYRREIIHLCTKRGILSYLEAKEQFDRNVLLTDEYYNGIIQCKIHASHVKDLKDDDDENW
jgi:hypothetical protein